MSWATLYGDNRILELYNFKYDDSCVEVLNQEYIDEKCDHTIHDFVVNDGIAEYRPTESQMDLRNKEQAEIEYKNQLEEATKLFINTNSVNMETKDIIKFKLLFNEWTIGNSYKTRDIVLYNNNLYQALQDSTAQEQYPPDNFVAGWKLIQEPNKEGIYPWNCPLGATDYYKLGDIVTHNGLKWESTEAVNVWEPGVYGWKRLD